ncbi:MAG: hypothetical protein HFE78_00565 [Clostridiales bacterium]|nr:hypothetical protein [Clostridiales bacterium]
MKKKIIAAVLILAVLATVGIAVYAISRDKDNNSSVGGEKSTEGETTSTNSSQPDSFIPDQSYVGEWYTDENPPDDLTIYEISSEFIKFETGLYRLFGFEAIAIQEDGEWKFGDGISPDYEGPSMLKGRLQFDENSVTVIYDDFGDFAQNNIQPNIYRFTIKNNDAKDTEPIDDQNRIIGKYTCVSDYCNNNLKDYPEYLPYITFNDDGTCEMLVYYIGGSTLLPGTYMIEDNKIFVEVDPSGTPVDGIDESGIPYMDDKYVFTITDYDHITIGSVEGAYFNGCYVAHNGDPFVRQ